MKKLLLTLVISAVGLTSGFAQIANDLEIFSESGLEFTVFMNGQKINENPQSNVKIENTNNEYALIKIVFKDTKIPDIERKNLQIGNVTPEDKGKPVSCVYKIKEKDGQYKLAFVSRSDKKNQDNKVIIINK